MVEYRATVEEPAVKKEIQPAKSVKSMFNSAPKAVDKKPKVEKKVDDKSPPSIKSDEIKSQSTTPKVSSPAVVKKTPGAKAKGNIASFFNSRPAASTSKKMESIPRTEKTPDRETETMKIESSDEDVKKTPARKNGAVKIESSDEDVKKSTDVPKQQIKKKTKLKVKKTKSNKRSRIMQMEDSSDEEKGKHFYFMFCIL